MSSALDTTFGATFIGVVIATLYAPAITLSKGYETTYMMLLACMAFSRCRLTHTGSDMCTIQPLTELLQVFFLLVYSGPHADSIYYHGGQVLALWQVPYSPPNKILMY